SDRARLEVRVDEFLLLRTGRNVGANRERIIGWSFRFQFRPFYQSETGFYPRIGSRTPCTVRLGSVRAWPKASQSLLGYRRISAVDAGLPADLQESQRPVPPA